ncbi:MAG: sensor histidine kinase [Verrucomicrobiales bacterium]
MVSDLREKGANVSVAKPLPNILGHTVTLTQVLLNLISNALKFIPPGRFPIIRLHAEVENAYAKLWIADNGIGIKPEDHGRIFRVFERLTGSDSYPGTGLGLAIVRKGVERMGGQVGVESSLGEGSRFWVRLKLSPSIPN